MRTHRHIWALAALALAAGCADYGAPDEVLYGTAVYTQPKPAFDPAALGTYWVDPVAYVIKDDPAVPEQLPLTGQYASILDTIDTNMQGLGYAKTILQPADGAQGVAVLRLAVLKGTAAVYYPGYWCDYWYYYSCYYNWYYAGSYNFGTVFLDMGAFTGPPAGLPPAPQLESQWVAAMYGVATSAVYDIPRVNDAINRAFAQSAYLAR